MVCERARHQKTTDKKKEKGRKEKMRRARNLRTLAKKSEQRSVDRVRKVENMYYERRMYKYFYRKISFDYLQNGFITIFV